MPRIGPGTGLSGPMVDNTTSDDKVNQKDEKRDKNADNDAEGGENGPIRAAAGTIRAGLHEEAGSQEIASDKHAAVGSGVDTVTTGSDSPNIVASGTKSLNKTVTSVVSENLTGGDGGTGVSINTQTGEADPGRPGDTSRVAEVINRVNGADGNPDPEPNGGSDPNPNGGSDGNSGARTVLQLLGGRGNQQPRPQPQGPSQAGLLAALMAGNQSGGSNTDKGLLSSLGPAGIALIAVVVGIVGFGASEVTDDGK